MLSSTLLGVLLVHGKEISGTNYHENGRNRKKSKVAQRFMMD